MRRWLFVLAATSGCISPDIVDCGGDIVCPANTVCATIQAAGLATGEHLCSTHDDLDACAGLGAYAACGTDHACYATSAGLVCLPSGCGNRLLDPQFGEVCDDGNSIVGDGCSYDCRSDETCGNGFLDPVKLDLGGNPIANETCDDANKIGRDGCSSECGLETPRWEQLVANTQPALQNVAMAYDAIRDRVVLFGGVRATGLGVTVFSSDTWEWDGIAWVQVTLALGPPGRAGTAMAYDRARMRTIVFGGEDGVARGDMWSWDGTSWTQLMPSQLPSPRFGHAMVYDPMRQRTVLFGGATSSTTFLADTWTWDGTTWTQLDTPIAPDARRAHAMTFDPVRGVIVMAGGTVHDTWELDGSTWRQVATDSTPYEVADSLAWDPITQRVISFGGETMTSLSGATWGWDGHSWTMLASTGPETRSSATVVSDPRRGQVVLYGGYHKGSCLICAGALADSWKWNGTAWTQIADATPPPNLSKHASAFDARHGRTLVFGGADETNTTSNATWLFDGAHWANLNISGPLARIESAMAYDSARDQFVLFGGADPATGAFGDTWVFDGASWSMLAPATSPTARAGHAMAYDQAADRIVLSGGNSRETWEWDGATWLLRNSNGLPVIEPSMAYDPIRAKVVQFGGQLIMFGTNPTLTWDHAAGTWTDETPSISPNARSMAGLSWNGARERMTMSFGLSTSGEERDTWEWNGTTWSPISTNLPPGREWQSTMPTPNGAGVFVFDGQSAGTALAAPELWRFQFVGAQAYEPCTADVDVDGDGLAGCADPDCWAVCSPLCPIGVAECDPALPHCGDGTCSSLETCRMCPSDCGACPAVCGDSFCDAPETHASCPGDCP